MKQALTTDAVTINGKAYACSNEMNAYCIIMPAVAPVLVAGPGGVVVSRFGKMIVLYCEGTGFPIPEITWYQNGTALDASTEDNLAISVDVVSSTRTVNSSLVIASPTVSKSGEYYCNLSSTVRAYEDLRSRIALVLVQSKY